MKALVPRRLRSRRTWLESLLSKAIDHLEAQGMRSPPGYRERLIATWRRRGVPYPWTLRSVADPNVRKHPSYEEVLRRAGRLLDFGCGIGHDLRALVKDGYPPALIVGYDRDRDGIDLGFDLFQDGESLGIEVVVSTEFPFRPESFDIVHSSSVLQFLPDDKELHRYLSNAYEVLRPGGILFGSTVVRVTEPRPGLPTLLERVGRRLERRPRPTLYAPETIEGALRRVGFCEVALTPAVGTRSRMWMKGRRPG